MVELTHIPSHKELAEDLTPSQFLDKPVWSAFLDTWMGAIQELEDTFYYDIAKARMYTNSYGDALDQYAHLFGITRSVGQTDSEIKNLIVGEVVKRASDGSADRIREIIATLTGIKGMQIFEHYPQAMLLWGYADEQNYSLTGSEAAFAKQGSPVGTGSVVVGFIQGSVERAFIPAEVVYQVANEVVHNYSIEDPSETKLDWNVVTPDSGNGLNNLVVRDNTNADFKISFTDSVLAQRGILAEVGVRQEKVFVDTASSPTGEQLLVDTTNVSMPPEQFNADFEGVENNKGILLEIVTHRISDDRTKLPVL